MDIEGIIRDEAIDCAIEHVEQGLTLAHLTEGWDLAEDDITPVAARIGRKLTRDEVKAYCDEFEAAVRSLLEVSQ